ncbi:MAG: hypothetical protein K0Q94_2672 [Paenibacillus sp.]|nr:hypothetical protein [Paenibacillus sp.]
MFDASAGFPLFRMQMGTIGRAFLPKEQTYRPEPVSGYHSGMFVFRFPFKPLPPTFGLRSYFFLSASIVFFTASSASRSAVLTSLLSYKMPRKAFVSCAVAAE